MIFARVEGLRAPPGVAVVTYFAKSWPNKMLDERHEHYTTNKNLLGI